MLSITTTCFAELLRRARFADRPPLNNLLHSCQTLAERNRAMTKAHLQYGYFQQEIDGQAGLHYSTRDWVEYRAVIPILPDASGAS